MEISTTDVRNLISSIDRLNKVLIKLEQIESADKSKDKKGPVISVFCVIVLLIVAFFQRADVSELSADFKELNRKYDRMQDHLNAVYMMAPHLKPKDVNDHSDNSASAEDTRTTY